MGMAACLKRFPDCSNMLSFLYCPALPAQNLKYSGTGSLFWHFAQEKLFNQNYKIKLRMDACLM
jgi:hypothetical protein